MDLCDSKFTLYPTKEKNIPETIQLLSSDEVDRKKSKPFHYKPGKFFKLPLITQAIRFSKNILGHLSHKTLGIDIGQNSVKLLELNLVGEKIQIESFAIAPLPKHAMTEHSIKNIPAVAEAIALAHQHSQTTVKKVTAALPNALTITKTLTLDACLNEQEVTEYMQLEAEHYLPFPLEEVAVDFTLLDRNSKEPTKTNVLLVAARHEQVEARVEAIRQAGLIPWIMDVESYAIERVSPMLVQTLPSKGRNQLIAIININLLSTTLTLLYDLQAIYHNDEILLEADHLPDAGSKISTSFHTGLITAIRRALQLFFSTHAYSEVNYILLAGDPTLLGGVCDLMQEQLTIPCALIQPFLHMTMNPHLPVEKFYTEIPALLTCCGLALRGIIK